MKLPWGFKMSAADGNNNCTDRFHLTHNSQVTMRQLELLDVVFICLFMVIFHALDQNVW